MGLVFRTAGVLLVFAAGYVVGVEDSDRRARTAPVAASAGSGALQPGTDSGLVEPDKAAVLTDPDRDPTPEARLAVATPATVPAPPQGVAAPPAPVPNPVALRPADPPPAPAQQMYVTGSRVNVRTGPGTDHAVRTSLPRGTAVAVTGSQGGWSRIRAAGGGEELWVSSRFLGSAPPVAPARVAPQPAARQLGVAPPTQGEIRSARRAIIAQSIAAYPGSCPCPYNVDRGGRRCGGRSAWSRPGGYAPVCYDSDITQSRLDSFLARRRGAVN